MTVADTDVFDAPTAWRARAARALGLRDDDLIAALSPGAAFPATLRTVRDALPAPVERLVDLGAGAGGASEWFRRATGAMVVAVEPAGTAASVAARTFPSLHVIRAEAADTPLGDRSADVVTLCGVLSLMHDVAPVVREARRLLRDGGILAVADLWAAGPADLRSGPNAFRSHETMRASLRHHGFAVSDVACGPADVTAEWSGPASVVRRWITEHCTDLPGFRQWTDDQDHLGRHVEAGLVIGGCVVARALR